MADPTTHPAHASIGSWTCHHCLEPVAADRTTWWVVDTDSQHVYCSQEHADKGCRKEHPA